MEEVTSCSFNSPLFQQEDKRGVTYRIPALLYVPPTHTFLAFAEKRSTCRDEDALHLVLRRGVRTEHSVQVTPHPTSGPGLSFSPHCLEHFRDCAFAHQCRKSPVWEVARKKQEKQWLSLTKYLLCARVTLDRSSKMLVINFTLLRFATLISSLWL